jgi:hypothetical protein
LTEGAFRGYGFSEMAKRVLPINCLSHKGLRLSWFGLKQLYRQHIRTNLAPCRCLLATKRYIPSSQLRFVFPFHRPLLRLATCLDADWGSVQARSQSMRPAIKRACVLAARLEGLLPRVRITEVLADVDRWDRL